jgi:hypothetical protein
MTGGPTVISKAIELSPQRGKHAIGPGGFRQVHVAHFGILLYWRVL